MVDKLLSKFKGVLTKSPGGLPLQSRLYDASVAQTLKLYERYVLPQEWWHGMNESKRISLRELKVKEFRDRKKLLNPYQKD